MAFNAHDTEEHRFNEPILPVPSLNRGSSEYRSLYRGLRYTLD